MQTKQFGIMMSAMWLLLCRESSALDFRLPVVPVKQRVQGRKKSDDDGAVHTVTIVILQVHFVWNSVISWRHNFKGVSRTLKSIRSDPTRGMVEGVRTLVGFPFVKKERDVW